VLNNTKWHML